MKYNKCSLYVKMMWNFKPDPLNSPHRGTLNVRTEKPELLLILYPH